MNRHLAIGSGVVLIGLIAFLGLRFSESVRQSDGVPFWVSLKNSWRGDFGPVGDSDPVLQIPLPIADPMANLTPSPLNAFLKPGLTPLEQTDVIGQLLLDYWSHMRTLPTGTWEETCAALSGNNAKKIAFVDRSHPALANDAFRPSSGAPGIHIHVVSASGGAFQLIYDGPDAKPFTDDDLIRNFPADLEF